MKAKLQAGKGVNKDLLSSELDLQTMSGCRNMRDRSGFWEKVGGITEIGSGCPVTPSYLSMIVVSIVANTNYLVVIGGTKAYITEDGTSFLERTKSLAAKTIFSMSRISSSVTEVVTSTAHGLITGVSIEVTGCTPSDHNTTSASITVIDTTTFRYTPDIATSAGAITPGAYVVNGGTGSYGTMPTVTSGGVLNGYSIVNSPTVSTGGIYASSGSNFRILSASHDICMVARVFRNWIFQLMPLRSNSTPAGYKPHELRWSDAAITGLPTTFTNATTNDSGYRILADTPGELRDAMQLGEEFFVYKSDERYRFRHIGGTEVFDIERMFDTSGLYGINCIANSPAGQFFLSRECDLRVHQGGPQSRSVAEGRMKEYLRSTISGTGVFITNNPFTKEIWVCYPNAGGSVANEAAIYSYEYDTWAIRDLPNVSAAFVGPVPGGTGLALAQRLIVGTSSPKIGYCDAGTTDLGSTITATLERTGIHLGDERRKKTLHRSSLSVDATAGNTATVTHGSHAFPDTAPSYQTGVTHTVGTTRDVNSFANSAEYVAWKLSTTATDYKLRTVEIECNEDGEF